MEEKLFCGKLAHNIGRRINGINSIVNFSKKSTFGTILRSILKKYDIIKMNN